MLLLLSTIATRCDFSALIVNRKMTTLVGAERESLVGAERVPRLLARLPVSAAANRAEYAGADTQRAVKRSDKMSRCGPLTGVEPNADQRCDRNNPKNAGRGLVSPEVCGPHRAPAAVAQDRCRQTPAPKQKTLNRTNTLPLVITSQCGKRSIRSAFAPIPLAIATRPVRTHAA